MTLLFRSGCFRTLLMLVIVVILAALVALGVLTLQDQGLIPWLGRDYQNQATVVLQSIQQMSVLTTTRYNFSSLVTTEREMPPVLAALYGERQVLIAVGHVTAGIDLSLMGPEDVTIANGTLMLHLPPPTLQDCFLNEGASYVAERDTGLFSRSAPELEGQARQFAIRQFRDNALQEGILTNVQQQATTALTEFIQLLGINGVSSVSIVTTEPDPLAPAPLSCQ
jgi:hypothetical protein